MIIAGRNVPHNAAAWIVVAERRIERHNVDVVHNKIIASESIRLVPADVYERGAIEAIAVGLIENENLMRDRLIVKKFGKRWNKRYQLFFAVTKWNENAKQMIVCLWLGAIPTTKIKCSQKIALV